MNDDNASKRMLAPPLRQPQRDDPEWVEIFAHCVADDLKQVLQEDMDWMTSLPILERLNRLREVEAARLKNADLRTESPGEYRDEFRKAS